MAKKVNANCSICGKPYHQCLSCREEVRTKPWKAYTDTVECYKVFQIIHGYSTKVYTKEEAKEKLQSIDLSSLGDLRDNIQDVIDDIMKEDSPKVSRKKTVAKIAEDIASEPVYEDGDMTETQS